MRKISRLLSITLALAMLCGEMALCQEPPSLPRLPRQEPVPESKAPEPEAADTTTVIRPQSSPEGTEQAGPQAAAADSSAPPAKPARKKLSFKPGKIVFDRNGKIYLAATAGLLAGIYIAYRVFQRGVK